LTGESKTLLGYSGISQMPDGRILYSKMTDKDINIFAMEETGGGEKQLTKDSGFNMQPVASPDGKYILFNSNRNGSHGIWRMNSDGSNPVQLTNFAEGADGQMQFANNGKTVIFTRHRSDGGSPVIMKVSIDGGSATPLIPDNQTPKSFPKVSPDGKQLAFHTFSYDSNTARFDASIKIVEFENEQIKNTEKEVELSLQPDFRWSPDGKALTYINRQGVDNLWNLSIENKKETPMTDFNSGSIGNFVWSQDKKKIFLIRSIVNSDLVLVKDTAKG
jgi:Tol biopolymer transport system component